MDHCLPFYGRLRRSTLFIHLQATIPAATAQFTNDFFLHNFLSWVFPGFHKCKEYSWKRMGRANLWPDRCCIHLCFPENPTRFSANPLPFCSANPLAMQPYFRHTSAHQPYFCHMSAFISSAFTRKYFVRKSFPHFE